MFRMSFDQSMLENVEEWPTVYVYAYADSSLHIHFCSCVRDQSSCTHGLIHVHMYLFLSLCVCSFHPAYAYLVPAYVDVGSHVHVAKQKPSPNLYFNCFLFKCKSNILLHYFCIRLWSPHHFSSHYESNIIFFPFSLQILAPFSSRASTNWVAIWYRTLTKETMGHIHATGFKPIICLLLERSASAILMQTLAKRRWDTTHTFHIANREMTMTPHDFHRMTSLRCIGALIN